MIDIVGEFIVSQWIWGITWAIYYIPISSLLLFSIIKIKLKKSIASALAQTLFIAISAFLLFTGVATLFIAYGDIAYSVTQPRITPAQPFAACMYLSFLYIFFEILLLLPWIVRLQGTWRMYITGIIVSNAIAGLLTYITIPAL